MAPLKLTYFAIPGKAEVARLLLTLGNIPFEDVRIAREQWLELKPKTPFGQVPILELEDGTVAWQSAAIDLYCAKLAGLLPEDPVEALWADALYFSVADLVQPLVATMSIQDKEAQLLARQTALKGPIHDRFTQLSKQIDSKPGPFFTGERPTHGDLGLFTALSMLKSGMFDGVPTDLLDAYPTLKAFRNRVASYPPVKAFYDKETDKMRVEAFTADQE